MPIATWAVDVAAQLSEMTRDVPRIPDVLERQLRPIYEAVGDAQATDAQMLIARGALYGAQERMFVHKHENKG